MSPARCQILHTRAPDQAHLAAEVAALLPGLTKVGRADARRAQAARKTTRIKTTFCPVCGGNKTKDAAQCGSCRDAAQRAEAEAARRAGHKSLGLRGASHAALYTRRIIMATTPEQPGTLNTSTRAHGLGAQRTTRPRSPSGVGDPDHRTG